MRVERRTTPLSQICTWEDFGWFFKRDDRLGKIQFGGFVNEGNVPCADYSFMSERVMPKLEFVVGEASHYWGFRNLVLLFDELIKVDEGVVGDWAQDNVARMVLRESLAAMSKGKVSDHYGCSFESFFPLIGHRLVFRFLHRCVSWCSSPWRQQFPPRLVASMFMLPEEQQIVDIDSVRPITLAALSRICFVDCNLISSGGGGMFVLRLSETVLDTVGAWTPRGSYVWHTTCVVNPMFMCFVVLGCVEVGGGYAFDVVSPESLFRSFVDQGLIPWFCAHAMFKNHCKFAVVSRCGLYVETSMRSGVGQGSSGSALLFCIYHSCCPFLGGGCVEISRLGHFCAMSILV